MKKVLKISIFITTATYLIILIYIAIGSTRDTKTQSDAILVLGARSYKSGKYNPCLLGRVNHSIDLYHNHYAQKLVFSGGIDLEDNQNESETMQKIAIEAGIPQKDIILETSSTSTYENLLFSTKSLQASKLASIIIVTDVFHSPRASLVARKLGLNFTLSPASESSCWQKWKYFQRPMLKEPIAVFWYWLTGKI